MPDGFRPVFVFFLLLIAASGATIACASGRFDHPALVAGQAPSAELVILRKNELAGGAYALTIELNGYKLVKLRTGRYAEFQVAPGRYELYFAGFQAVPSAILSDLSLAPGSRTYVILGQRDIAWGTSVNVNVSAPGGSSVGVTAIPIMGFHVLPEEQAWKLIESYQLVGVD